MAAYEDLVILSRAIMSGEKVTYIDESLVKYRVGSGVTSNPFVSGDGLGIFIEKKSFVDTGSYRCFSAATG